MFTLHTTNLTLMPRIPYGSPILPRVIPEPRVGTTPEWTCFGVVQVQNQTKSKRKRKNICMPSGPCWDLMKEKLSLRTEERASPPPKQLTNPVRQTRPLGKRPTITVEQGNWCTYQAAFLLWLIFIEPLLKLAASGSADQFTNEARKWTCKHHQNCQIPLPLSHWQYGFRKDEKALSSGWWLGSPDVTSPAPRLQLRLANLFHLNP